MEEDLRKLCEATAWTSFWLVGIWILLILSPIILLILLIKSVWRI